MADDAYRNDNITPPILHGAPSVDGNLAVVDDLMLLTDSMEEMAEDTDTLSNVTNDIFKYLNKKSVVKTVNPTVGQVSETGDVGSILISNTLERVFNKFFSRDLAIGARTKERYVGGTTSRKDVSYSYVNQYQNIVPFRKPTDYRENRMTPTHMTSKEVLESPAERQQKLVTSTKPSSIDVALTGDKGSLLVYNKLDEINTTVKAIARVGVSQTKLFTGIIDLAKTLLKVEIIGRMLTGGERSFLKDTANLFTGGGRNRYQGYQGLPYGAFGYQTSRSNAYAQPGMAGQSVYGYDRYGMPMARFGAMNASRMISQRGASKDLFLGGGSLASRLVFGRPNYMTGATMGVIGGSNRLSAMYAGARPIMRRSLLSGANVIGRASTAWSLYDTVKSGMEGFGNAEELGTTKMKGTISGLLAGKDMEGGLSSALRNAPRFMFLGASTGFRLGGLPGAIAGSIFGGAVGALFGGLGQQTVVDEILPEFANPLEGYGTPLGIAGAIIGLGLGGPLMAVVGGGLGVSLGATIDGVKSAAGGDPVEKYIPSIWKGEITDLTVGLGLAGLATFGLPGLTVGIGISTALEGILVNELTTSPTDIFNDLKQGELDEATVTGLLIGAGIGGFKGAMIGMSVGSISGDILSSVTKMDTTTSLYSMAGGLSGDFAITGGVVGFLLGGTPRSAILGAGVGFAIGTVEDELLGVDTMSSAQQGILSGLALSGAIVGYLLGGPLGMALGVQAGGAVGKVALGAMEVPLADLVTKHPGWYEAVDAFSPQTILNMAQTEEGYQVLSKIDPERFPSTQILDVYSQTSEDTPSGILDWVRALYSNKDSEHIKAMEGTKGYSLGINPFLSDITAPVYTPLPEVSDTKGWETVPYAYNKSYWTKEAYRANTLRNAGAGYSFGINPNFGLTVAPPESASIESDIEPNDSFLSTKKDTLETVSPDVVKAVEKMIGAQEDLAQTIEAYNRLLGNQGTGLPSEFITPEVIQQVREGQL